MTSDREGTERRTLDSLARVFLSFAEHECGNEPVYDALCRAAAEDPRTLELLWEAPRGQQKPNLLLAAVHFLILSGTSHPIGAYFPSVGGARPIDTAFAPTFVDFRDGHRSELAALIARRATQTNEIGRCAVAWPALNLLAATRGRSKLALLDFGCSAGLNLGVDAYRYDYGVFALGAPETPRTPVIRCELRGPRRPYVSPTPVVVASRLGIDVAPNDLNDPDAMQWLRACIWPHDRVRAARFDRAVEVARRGAWPVRRAPDPVAAVGRFVSEVPEDVLPVVWNSFVLYYLDVAGRARHVTAMERLVETHGAVWLSTESEGLRMGPDKPGAAYTGAAAWTACVPSSSGTTYVTLARSHPHGTWLEWLVDAP